MDLKHLIEMDDCSVAVKLQNNEVIKRVGKSVRPLYDIYLNFKNEMDSAHVADRIVGKAAACLLVDAKVKNVYTFLLSRSAKQLLESNGIEVECVTLCEYIENRHGTDLCPMEKLIVDIDDIADCIEKIDWFTKNVQYPNS